MQNKGPVWNGIHRELLEKLGADVAPFASRGDFDRAAYRAAAAETVARLAELTGTNPYYLARCFRTAEKHECSISHYEWLLDAVTPAALKAMLHQSVELWAAEAGEARYSVSIYVEQWVAREGELTLCMLAGRTEVFWLSFSVVPGRRLGLDAERALLVSRLQGAPDRFEELRAATKAMSDVAPRAVAFAVLTGIARAVGCDHIAGVGAENFITYAPEKHEALERQYDEFFKAVEAQPLDGFFVLDLRIPPKPVTDVKAGHRIRTRKKRALKEAIAEAAAQAWIAKIRAA